jgi:putative DNA primase/helicase
MTAQDDPPGGALPPVLDAPDEERRQELLDSALSYARRGWQVMPVRWIGPDGHCSCHAGAQCASPGKHPVHQSWPDFASSDVDEVAGWWRPEAMMPATEWWPYANIGIVTGRRSGIFAMDVDTYNGGDPTLAGYERRHGPLPETRVHHTGSGGVHYLFAHPGFDIRNSAGKALGRGLDVRGENGFIVAPPSVSAKGAYELSPAHDIDPAEAPGWLIDLLRGHDRVQNGSALAGAFPAEAAGSTRRYAEAALRAEAARVRDAPSGERNDTLNAAAFSLGTLGGAGILSEAEARAALCDAARAAGLGEGEANRTFTSGWRKGLAEPRVIQWQATQADWPARPQNEFGLADRMADRYGDTLRWNPTQRTWMRYKAGVWVTDVPEAGEWAAQVMLRTLADTEAMSFDDEADVAADGTVLPSPRDRFLEWVKKQQTAKAVNVANKLARGLPLMQIDQATFDADPMALNVTDGVVDLATGERRPHDPEDRMTLQCMAAYRPGARAPQWEAFLATVQPDPTIRFYLQLIAGYCATGDTSEQVFFLHHGSGANGKGVFHNVISHLLGSYSQTLPVETLMASSIDGRIPNDVARMVGRRWLGASETKAGKSLDEQKLKQLTGEDAVAARFMRNDFFEFKPVGKIHLTTNHLPRVSDDGATWRRVRLITWPVVIPEEHRDRDLQRRLVREEGEGILAWIIEGAVQWRRRGLQVPGAAVEAAESYRKDEDIVAQFAEDCLEVVPPERYAVSRSCADIWTSYAAWCKREGHMPPRAQRWLTASLRKEHEYYRGNGWAGFPGLQVRLPFSGSALPGE